MRRQRSVRSLVRMPHAGAITVVDESLVKLHPALMWLETMARLNFLRRNEGWTKLYVRFVDDRDRAGVWHPHKGTERPLTTHPWAWSTFPLDDGAGQEAKWADVTFRIGLIGRLLGREIELI